MANGNGGERVRPIQRAVQGNDEFAAHFDMSPPDEVTGSGHPPKSLKPWRISTVSPVRQIGDA